MFKLTPSTALLYLSSFSLPLCAQISNGVFRVSASGCGQSGGSFSQSAFKPAGSAVLITALHGVAGCSAIKAYDAQGAPALGGQDLRIDRADVPHDIAELVGGTAFSTEGGLNTAHASLQSFQILFVYGFPGGRVVSRGTEVRVADPPLIMLNSWPLGLPVRNALNERMSPNPDLVDFVDIDGVLMPGHSGAPLLNTAHQVIAIGDGGLNGGADNRSWAVPWAAVTLSPFSAAQNSALGHPPDVLFAYDQEAQPLPAIATQPVAEGAQGTVSINGVGYIPGLRGRLTPILDSANRTYLYADNIAINGGEPQPVDFSTGKRLQLEDSEGNRFSVVVTAINSSSTKLSYAKLQVDRSRFAGPLDVTATDDTGAVLAGAAVAVLFPDGTSVAKITNSGGEARFALLKNFFGNITVTSPRHLAVILSDQPLSGSLTATLRRSEVGGSLILKGNAGEIPGLDGGLNPILDAEGRMYLYADNIAINGGKIQPVTFSLNAPMTLEDSDGHRVSASIVAINDSSSTLEYTPERRSDSLLPEAEVTVFDESNNPVRGADVIVVFSDGTVVAGESNLNGIARFHNLKQQTFGLFVARPGFDGATLPNQDGTHPITAIIHSDPFANSCVFVGRKGQIPGLQGTIQPILDAENRRYLYATSLEVNGNSPQPVDFALGQKLTLRDGNGVTMNMKILATAAYASLVEYSKADQ